MQKDPPQTIDKKIPSMLVDVMRVHAANEKITVKAQGSVTPRTQTTLISEVFPPHLSLADSSARGTYWFESMTAIIEQKSNVRRPRLERLKQTSLAKPDWLTTPGKTGNERNQYCGPVRPLPIWPCVNHNRLKP